MKEIRAIRFDHPYLITAYIYHMYLGLHTGAKILRQKFKLKGKTLELDAKLNVSIHVLQKVKWSASLPWSFAPNSDQNLQST